MKKVKKSVKLNLEKFTVAKLSNPSSILGGTDDGTDTKNQPTKVCILKSRFWVDKK